MIGPRCANHTDPPYPYSLGDLSDGSTVTPTGGIASPTGPLGTGRPIQGSNNTAGPSGFSVSPTIPSVSYPYSNSSIITTAGPFATGGTTLKDSRSRISPFPTSNSSAQGTGAVSGTGLSKPYPYVLNHASSGVTANGVGSIPTGAIFVASGSVIYPIPTASLSGSGIGPLSTGGSASSVIQAPFGNSSSTGPIGTGNVIAPASSAYYIYHYDSATLTSGIDVVSATSFTPSSNTSVVHLTETISGTISGTFTLTTFTDTSMPRIESTSGPSGSNATSPTNIGSSITNGVSPSDVASASPTPLISYHTYDPSSSGAEQPSSSGNSLPNATSTGTGSPDKTGSVSLTTELLPSATGTVTVISGSGSTTYTPAVIKTEPAPFTTETIPAFIGTGTSLLESGGGTLTPVQFKTEPAIETAPAATGTWTAIPESDSRGGTPATSTISPSGTSYSPVSTNSTSSALSPVGTTSASLSSIGSVSIPSVALMPSTFDTSLKGGRTTSLSSVTSSLSSVPTEYYYHHRRPQKNQNSYSSVSNLSNIHTRSTKLIVHPKAGSYGSSEFDFDFENEDDNTYG